MTGGLEVVGGAVLADAEDLLAVAEALVVEEVVGALDVDELWVATEAGVPPNKRGISKKATVPINKATTAKATMGQSGRRGSAMLER